MSTGLFDSYRRLRKYVLPACIFSVLGNLIYLAPSLYSSQLYERVLVTGSLPTLAVLSIGLAVLLIVQYVLEYVRGALLALAGGQFDRDTRPALAGLLLSSGVDKAGGRSVPYNSAAHDSEAIKLALGGPAIGALFDAPWTILFIIVLALVHPALGLLAVGFAIAQIVVAGLTHMALGKPNQVLAERSVAAGGLSDTLARSAGTVNSLGVRSVFEAKWSAVRDSLVNQQTDIAQTVSGWSATSRVVRITAQSAVMGLGAWLAVRHEIGAGGLFASAILLGRALAPVDILVGNLRQLSQAWAAVKRLPTWFGNSPRDLGIDPGKLNGAIALKGVSLVAGKKAILEKVSFGLPAGATLAVVGPSGSGKSSLLQVIAGAYAYSGGEVTIDNVRVEHFSQAARARSIGYLPQAVDLLPGTIRDNICLFSGASDEEVVQAARLAGAHDLIGRLPDGYQSQVGPGGIYLSPGQAQRIGLARALFGSPAIVILDEPNSALDGEGEIALVRALHHLKALKTTVLVVAHKPQITATADLFAVMQEGRLTQYGSAESIRSQIAAPAKPVAAPTAVPEA